MNWCDFEPGKRVVCVYDFSADPMFSQGVSLGACFPTLGKVYTVRNSFVMSGDIIGIHLIEITNPLIPIDENSMGEMGFDIRAFRPVDETKIDQFRELLTPVKTDKVLEVAE